MTGPNGKGNKLTAKQHYILPLTLLICILLGTPVDAGGVDRDRPLVTIDQGSLVGSFDKGLKIFKAIPYALAPTGNRRWRSPEPAASWPGTREAATFGPGCIQPPASPKSIYADEPASMSEDCLTLNIWAPERAKKMPVIVWIHGGALRGGYSGSPHYDGANFARRDIVFVSINYRLGVLGWLAHPDFSAESSNHVSGNYGLLDQIQALRWVRDNISAFGGDSNNVTIMGESAGALSVTYLMSSPLAKGLFHKAIAQSANSRAFPELRQSVYGLPSAEQIGVVVANSVGAADLKSLRAMDARLLERASRKARFMSQGTIDGWALPYQIIETFDRGEQAHVPLLAGFNSGEIRSQPYLVPPVPASAALYEAKIKERYRDLSSEFLRLYPSSDVKGNMLATVRDAVYGWATERMVRKQSALGLPAYLYLFDHCYPAAAKRGLCAFHASELPYVFGHVGAEATLPVNWPRPEGEGERALSDVMMGYWVNFAKTGLPGKLGHVTWQAYSKGQAYMHFKDNAISANDPVSGMFEMQEELVKRRQKAGQQWFVNVGVVAPLMPDTKDVKP